MLPLTAAVPGALAELLRDSPLSRGKVEFAWKASVGTALQRATAVCLEQGVLLVDAQSAQWALEVRRSSRIILRRMQSLLGEDVIREIVVRA
jgi:predicted nucleic acid-binding Zn ribbon protein